MTKQTLWLVGSLTLIIGACDTEPESGNDPGQADEAILAEEELTPEDLAAIPLPPSSSSTKTHAADVPLAANPDPTNALYWTDWYSEEGNESANSADIAMVCNTGEIAIGADCDGWYCDLVRLRCLGIDYFANVGERTWGHYIQGESWHSYVCPEDKFISGISCKGDWCHWIAVECTDVGYSENCEWTGWHSEQTGAMVASGGRAFKGVQCAGNHCQWKRYQECDYIDS